MTIEEAQEIIDKYEYEGSMTKEEEFLYIEAYQYLIEQTKDTRYMIGLGGYYYGQKDFDLALKYYEMADTYGDTWAPEGLGYIWYYGRTGKVDYEKAFHYYSRAAKNGSYRSKIKIADMYKNGYYVQEDYKKYCRIIEELYEYMENRVVDFNFPIPEIDTRLAKIRIKEGRIEEAIKLYLNTRIVLEKRLEYNLFFGDFNIMKWLIEDLYKITDIDYIHFDLYDLYEILKKPIKVAFTFEDEDYIVEAIQEGNNIVIKFGDTWYQSIQDFFMKATIHGEKLPVIYERIHNYRVI